MSYRARIIIAMIVIVIVTGFDYQFLSMYPDTLPLPEFTRRAGHFITLVIVMLCGGFALAKNPLAWISAIWWYSYTGAITFLFLMGILTHIIHVGYHVLFAFFNFRVFFSSPLPFFILYILSKLNKDQPA